MRRYSRSWSAIVGKPPARSAGDPVRRIAAQGDEVRNLLRLDAVALAHLLRPDALELRHAALRVQDGRPRRGQLKEIAIVRQHERRAFALFLRSDGGRQEVVRFV